MRHSAKVAKYSRNMDSNKSRYCGTGVSKRPSHVTVMAEEVARYLNPPDGAVVIDATVGLGGHSEYLLQTYPSISKIIAMDVDCDALRFTKERLAHSKEKITLVNKNFAHVKETISSMGIEHVDGMIADLGISSYQLEQSGRGFSFRKDEFLDMRMDTNLDLRAYDLVNKMKSGELEHILKNYGEEKFARRISNSIVRSRQKKNIETSSELASIVFESIPKRFHPKKKHPATKTFQALRISINNELDNLTKFIEQSVKILKKGARLAIISFHSLEDRIVKNMFRKFDSPCICPPDLPVCSCGKVPSVKIVKRSVIKPRKNEVIENPRARSAKMRVVEGV